jgi:diguanylate cyclase (GGDEF)-like protein
MSRFCFCFIISIRLFWPGLTWSALFYGSAYFALNLRKNTLAVTLIWFEVIAHSALGTLLIGWESGFHYYLLIFIPILFITMPVRSAVFALIGLWSYYVCLDVLMWFTEPIQPIAPKALLLVHMFNLSVVFAIFSYLSFLYLGMVVSAQRKLHTQASVDPLTGLLNRRQGGDLAEKEIVRFQSAGHPASFLLLDIDHFKRLNDTYGHELGDKVLTETGRVMRAHVRAEDVVTRWGGEEFLIILPDTDIKRALASAERICSAMRHHNWQQVTDEPIAVTVSAGVSELCENDDMAAVIRRADEALYRAKDAGRDRAEQENRGEVGGV